MTIALDLASRPGACDDPFGCLNDWSVDHLPIKGKSA
jgi:hypothetical protein